MDETALKRQRTLFNGESVAINVAFPNLHSACILKFEMMFNHIYHLFREFHKMETITLFNKWIRTLNNKFIKNTNCFYLLECELSKDALKYEYHHDVEIICCVFVILIAKLYMDDIVCKHFRCINSDYVNCMKTLRRMDCITSKEYKIGMEFFIFDNNMQSALYLTRNDTVDRTPIYYYKNVKYLIKEMSVIEKKVVKHLDWKLFNPIYLTPKQHGEKDISKSQRKHPERYLGYHQQDDKRRSSNHTMGWSECISEINLLLSGKKRVRQYVQEDQVYRAHVDIECNDAR